MAWPAMPVGILFWERVGNGYPEHLRISIAPLPASEVPGESVCICVFLVSWWPDLKTIKCYLSVVCNLHLECGMTDPLLRQIIGGLNLRSLKGKTSTDFTSKTAHYSSHFVHPVWLLAKWSRSDIQFSIMGGSLSRIWVIPYTQKWHTSRIHTKPGLQVPYDEVMKCWKFWGHMLYGFHRMLAWKLTFWRKFADQWVF